MLPNRFVDTQGAQNAKIFTSEKLKLQLAATVMLRAQPTVRVGPTAAGNVFAAAVAVASSAHVTDVISQSVMAESSFKTGWQQPEERERKNDRRCLAARPPRETIGRL